jgi:hypothetical protein
MREISQNESENVRGGSNPPGLLGYEGQPGNQGGNNNNNNNNSNTGYEGQPGNQSNG